MISVARDLLAVVLLTAAVTACDGPEGSAELPPPAEYTGEAIGYFCGMLLAEHGGPKGQVHLRSREAPLWFSSVRDTVAFTLLEGEPKDVRVIYVNDMGRAKDWEAPEAGTWVEIGSAWFVIGSRRMGGMGLPEVIPFGAPGSAESHVGEYGGRVVRLAEIPPDYVLGMPALPSEGNADHADH
jgi:copper chaperone NosL